MADPDPGVLKQVLERIQGGGIPNFAKAFVAAWGELPSRVVKNANNPHFGNDYADLTAVLDLVKPVFAKHHLAMLQAPGELEGDKISVHTVIMHESGESVSFKSQLPIGAKATAQAGGSAITYGRRYAAQAIAGIAPADDDGEAASSTEAPKRERAKKSGAAESPAEVIASTESYAARKEALVKEIQAADCKTPEEVSEKFKARVEEFGDEDINKVYVEKRKALRGKK